MRGGAGSIAVLAVLGGLSVGLVANGLRPERADAQSLDSSSGAIQNQPLPPPPGTSETNVLAPDAGSSPAANPPAPPVPEAPTSAAAPSVAAPSQWVPQQQAQLTVLDKIYGSATTVSAKAGVPFSVRFLTVTVLACWIRPPTLPPDAAAFVQVTDSHAAPGAPPEFRGWIFKAEPALSGMNDPVTDISVDGCG
jgi:hypothetical protein